MANNFYWLCRALVKGFSEKYVDFKVSGLECLPRDSAIIVANHEIGPDSMLLGTQIPQQIHYLTDSNLGNIGPLNLENISSEEIKRRIRAAQLKALLWSFGQIAVNTDKRSSNKQVFGRVGEYLRETRDYVGIFAEGPTKDLTIGGLPKPLEDREYNQGAAHFAVKYNKPIVPIALATLDEVVNMLWEAPFGKRNEKIKAIKAFVERRGKIPYIIQIGLPLMAAGKEQLNAQVKAEIYRMYNLAKNELK